MRRSVLATLLLAACHFGPPSADDYDSTCETVDDCVAVIDRGHCGCSCDTWVALNKDVVDEFTRKQDRHFKNHNCRQACLMACFPAPDESQVTVACDAGQCVADAPWGGSGLY